MSCDVKQNYYNQVIQGLLAGSYNSHKMSLIPFILWQLM
jgi:hypothetical protein